METHENSLSAAQWAVMEHLWSKGSLSGREAAERMGAETGWNRSTTLTLLRRMEEKGFVRSGVEGGVKLFYPVLRREDAAMQVTENLLERVYHGSISMLLSALTHKQNLSQEEIHKLHALLDGMEGK
jgi:predicted transcriptional regulator